MADFERATREDCEGRIQRHAAVERANAQQSIDRIRSELEIVQDKYVHTCGYYLWILPVDTTCGYYLWIIPVDKTCG
jgi:hypothetical protein